MRRLFGTLAQVGYTALLLTGMIWKINPDLGQTHNSFALIHIPIAVSTIHLVVVLAYLLSMLVLMIICLVSSRN